MKLRSSTLLLGTLLLSLPVAVACGEDSKPDDQGGSGSDSDGSDSDGGDGGECPSYLTTCDERCVNVDVDPRHCGDCETTCGAGRACVDGVCEETSCPTGQVSCGAACVTLTSDSLHCGDCDTACESGTVCSAGVCEVSCGVGLLACGESCVDPSSDPDHCGATDCGEPATSGVSCGVVGACVEGECREFVPRARPSLRVDTASFAVDTGENAIASDASGNAVAIWRQGTASGGGTPDATQRVFARRYDVAEGVWIGDGVRIDAEAERPRNLRLALEPDGDGAASWVSESTAVKLARFDGETKTWSPPITISEGGGEVGIPSLAVGGGLAFVAWTQAATEGGPRVPHVRTVDLATGALGTLESPETLGNGAAGIQVVANAAGAAALVWEDDTNASTNTQTGVGYVPALRASISSGGTWLLPTDLRTDSASATLAGIDAALGIDDAGHVVVAWSEVSGGEYRVYARRYDGSAWSAPQGDGGSGEFEPSVAVAADGTAIVTYTQDYFNDPFQTADPDQCRIVALRWPAGGSAWQTELAYTLPTYYPESYHCPVARVTIDAGAHPLLTWLSEPDAGNAVNVMVSRYDAVWSTPVGVNSTYAYLDTPWVTQAPNGVTHLAWTQVDDTTVHLYASVLR